MGAWVQVAYREAITRNAEVDYTHKKQSGGSGQFARVKVKFEPANMDEEGATSDFEFVSEIKGGVVPKEYIPGVQKVRCTGGENTHAHTNAHTAHTNDHSNQ